MEGGVSKSDFEDAIVSDIDVDTRKEPNKFLIDISANKTISEKTENKLAKELKKLCQKSGNEKQPKKSAEILHKLGQVYFKRSSTFDDDDKDDICLKMINLIRSACLFNAALARKPENVQIIQDDLKELCRQVLLKAGASNIDADLIAQSSIVKQDVEKMREMVRQRLDEIQELEKNEVSAKQNEESKIHAIKTLQSEITTKYTDIMAQLLLYCQTVMGDPPCKFALVGMGSLARKEITPYSDFEHIIVLEQESKLSSNYEDILNYFRWLSVIFQIVLINLQETIVPNVGIPSLKDQDNKYWFYDNITTRGIGFDGMVPHASKFPLGRTEPTENKQWTTELIKPVDEMLRYLNSDEDLKNGYHLKDILTKVCYVGGDKTVFDDFQTKVYARMKEESREEKYESIRKILVDDLDNFATKSNILNLSSTAFNLKKDFYRSSTIFISALGQLNNVEVSSCFDISEALEKMGVINTRVKHYQMYAVALACELRLKWYMKQNTQNDDIKSSSEDQDSIQLLLDTMNASSMISYFQIAYALQCDISKQFGLKKIHFYTDPKLLNCKLYYRFRKLQSFHKFIENRSVNTVDKTIRFYSVEEIMNQLEEELKQNQINENKLSPKPERNELVYNHGFWLREQGSPDEAKELFEIYLDLIKKTRNEKSSSGNQNLGNVWFQLGLCLMGMNEYVEANEYLQKSLKIKKQISLDITVDVAGTLNNIGNCLVNMYKPEEALTYLQLSLKINEKASLDPTVDVNVAKCLNNIANCFKKMHKPDETFAYLQRSLKIDEQTSLDPTIDVNLAMTLDNIGNCLVDMHKLDEAFTYLQRSLKIKEQASRDPTTDVNVAVTLTNIGNCLMDMHKPDEAFTYLQQSLKISEQASLDPTIDINVAATLDIIGDCLWDMHKLEKAFKYLQRSLEIKEKASFDFTIDFNILQTLNRIGRCLMDMHKPDEAFTYLQRSMRIAEQVSRDPTTDVNIAKTISTYGLCLLDMHKPDEALTYLQRSMKMYEQASLDRTVDVDVDFAETLHHIGKCLAYSCKPDEALTYLQRSLKMYEQASFDRRVDLNIAKTLNGIAICLIKMQKPEEAFSYFQRSLKIDEQASVDPTRDVNVAETLNNIGNCLIEMHKPDEAFTYLQRSLQIKEKASLDPTIDTNVANTLYCINICLLNMHNPEEASTYLQRFLKIHEQAPPVLQDH